MAALGLLSSIALSPALWGFTSRAAFPILPLPHALFWQLYSNTQAELLFILLAK